MRPRSLVAPFATLAVVYAVTTSATLNLNARNPAPESAPRVSEPVPASQLQQGTPTQGGAQSAQPVFRSSVELVNISVTVTDDKGKMLTNLTKEDFVILENGKPREIINFQTVTEKGYEPPPIGLGLVLDVSGSMSPDRLGSMRTAVEHLVNNRLKKTDELYLVEFASNARTLHDWSTDRRPVMSSIRNFKTREGTAIYDAIAHALPVSGRGKQKKQVMLVITDGADTSSKVNRAELIAQARASEVIIYAVVVGGEEGVGRGQNTAGLRQAAGELSQVTGVTGGRTLFVQGFQELENAIQTFGKDFTAQYEIGFERSDEENKYHEVRVGVRRPNVTVRHKMGYMTD